MVAFELDSRSRSSLMQDVPSITITSVTVGSNESLCYIIVY